MMNRKVLALALVSMLTAGTFAGCGNDQADGAGDGKTSGGKSVSLSVVTTYGADDGNRSNYEKVIKDYEAATGNKVKDNSTSASEDWKVKVMTDFEVGAEPDVLFYFTDADSNTLVKGGKVVSVDTIREQYPDYASNMKDDMLSASQVDGKKYAIPVNGIWESLFINGAVLEQAGVKLPGSDYTWDQFLQDCETIKNAGFTPIAASLFEIPNYWFEFTTYNYLKPADFFTFPGSADDANGKAWASGLNDIKTLFEKGYFPANTNTATDTETYNLFLQDQAAFLVDGSWKVGDIVDKYENLENIHVGYFPSNGEGRKTTDIIAGLTMGYYITQKAWDDPEKRDAAVKFVMAATTDEAVASFCSAGNSTALKNGLPAAESANSLLKEVNEMVANASGSAPAVEDLMDAKTVRDTFMKSIKKVCSGDLTPEALMEQTLKDQADFIASNQK